MSEPSAVQHPPYCDPTVGDVIIRTCDGVEFHIYRRRLSDASPIFADMFALGHGPAAEALEEADVVVSESSAVWEKLLPFCHLAEEPPVTLDDIPLLFEAGRKYRMVAVTCRMRSYLFRPEFLDEKPFAVYALACMAGVPHVATLAARRTLTTSIYPEYAKEFAYVSGLALYNLLEYRRRCGIAASEVVSVTNSNEVSPWMRSSPVLADMKICSSVSCLPLGRSVYVRGLGVHFINVRCSFVAYLERLHEVLKLRPDSSLASATSMLSPVIASALGCRTCASTIYEDTTRCAKVLERNIEEAILKVELVVET